MTTPTVVNSKDRSRRRRPAAVDIHAQTSRARAGRVGLVGAALGGTGSSTATPAAPGGTTRQLTGPSIDPTGVTASTRAVQDILDGCRDGDTVTVPDGVVLTMDGPLRVRHRIVLTGSGELRFVSGIAHDAALHILADGCVISGVRLTSPTDTGAADGSASFGVKVEADSVAITSTCIDGFQNGIAVAADGEFHDIVIAHNQVLNIRGVGGGPTSSSAAGEDRGDGIVVWGAAATIVGNRVTACAGTDARIGIHVEALTSYDVTAYPLTGSMCTIVANVVSGPFRRGIADEGVSHVTITGNAIADATWWGIGLSGAAHFTSVTANTIRWTRTATDNQGSAWSPSRAAVMVYDNPRGTSISSNTVHVDPGASLPSAFVLQAASPSLLSSDITIADNTVVDDASGITNGVLVMAGSTATSVLDNVFDGVASFGVRAASAEGLIVRGNRFTGAGAGGSVGVQLEGAATSRFQLAHNTIAGIDIGFMVLCTGAPVSIVGNCVLGGSVGIDLRAASPRSAVSMNSFDGTATPLTNLPKPTSVAANVL